MTRLAYQEVRDLVKQQGGTMRFLKKRIQDGVWPIMLDGKMGVFPAMRRHRTEVRQQGYVGIRTLYVTGQFPQLRDDALERLKDMPE